MTFAYFPLFDQTLERAILGAAMLDPDVACMVLELDESAFAAPEEKKLLRSMKKLGDRQDEVSMAAMRIELATSGQLDAIGGVQRLLDCCELASSAEQGIAGALAASVEKLRGFARRREIVKVLDDARAAMISNTLEGDVVTAAEAAAKLMASSAPTSKTFEMIGPLAARTLDAILNHPAEHAATRRIAFGLPGVDTVTAGGAPKARLTLIAARPGCGKTSLGMTLVRSAAKSSQRGIFFTLENTNEDTALHLIGAEAGVSTEKIAKRDIPASSAELLRTACATFALSMIQVDERHKLSVASIRGEAKRFTAAYGAPDFVMVDHLSLMELERGENQNIRIGATSRALKLLAKELDTAMIVLCQMNRAVEGRSNETPKLSDLRDSGSLEQDADLILFCHTPKKPTWKEPRQPSKIFISKNRGLATGEVALEFAADLMLFRGGA